MNRKICLYNVTDMDGITSAAIIKQRYPDILLCPLSYDNPYNCDDIIHPGDTVIIVNFTLQPFEKMVHCSEMCDLIWISHSGTSIDEYNEYVERGDIDGFGGSLNKKRSTCEMTWEYMFPDVNIPYTVWLLGRYSMWDYNPSSSIIPFQFGMKLNHEPPEDIVFWDKVFSSDRDGEFIHNIMDDGRVIIRYRERLNKKLCDVQSFESTITNHKCICINRGLCGSHVFDSIWNREKYDLMVVFYICDEGSWNVSLYTDKEGIDVGKIAKRYGGGGSVCTAGFRCSLLPFDIIG